MNYIALVTLLLLPIAAEGQVKRFTFKRGLLVPLGHCRPVDPECPIPPRLPPGARLMSASDLGNLPAKSIEDLAFAWTRPAGSLEVIDFGVAIFAGKDRVYREVCNCKDELSKLKPGETIVFTFDTSTSKDLARHFVEKNSMLVYTVSTKKKNKASQITVFPKKALSE